MAFKQTFSLVELFICMAIVSLLMTLLSPSLKRMVKASRQTGCQNKMRLVIQAQYLRAEDNSGYFGKSGVFDKEPFDGYFNELCQTIHGSEGIGFYGVEIAPYFNKQLKNPKWSWKDYWLAFRDPNLMDFLLCPSDEEPTTGSTILRQPLTQWQAVLTSFLMNGNLLSYRSNRENYLLADSQRVNNPSSLMMITDANSKYGSRFITSKLENGTYYDLVYNKKGGSKKVLPFDRHGSHFENNVGFVDGHVIKASLDDFKSIYITQSFE